MRTPKEGSQNRVGLHRKEVSLDGKYHRVHWGTGQAYNRNYRRFSSLTRARSFARKISKTCKYQEVK